MIDNINDIIIGDSIASLDLIRLKNEHRRLHIFEISSGLAHVRYRNFDTDSGGRRQKDENGAWKLDPLIDKWVVIS